MQIRFFLGMFDSTFLWFIFTLKGETGPNSFQHKFFKKKELFFRKEGKLEDKLRLEKLILGF